jgi:hypothetical protein
MESLFCNLKAEHSKTYRQSRYFPFNFNVRYRLFRLIVWSSNGRCKACGVLLHSAFPQTIIASEKDCDEATPSGKCDWISIEMQKKTVVNGELHHLWIFLRPIQIISQLHYGISRRIQENALIAIRVIIITLKHCQNSTWTHDAN